MLKCGSEEFVESSKTSNMSPPHDHKHILGKYYLAEKNM